MKSVVANTLRLGFKLRTEWVIQGDTKHFDFVCQATALGIKDVALSYNVPVIFGVLTDNTLQQAIDRSGGKHGNKGDEAAITAMKMVQFQKEV